jgi:hypothetical protein
MCPISATIGTNAGRERKGGRKKENGRNGNSERERKVRVRRFERDNGRKGNRDFRKERKRKKG